MSEVSNAADRSSIAKTTQFITKNIIPYSQQGTLGGEMFTVKADCIEGLLKKISYKFEYAWIGFLQSNSLVSMLQSPVAAKYTD